MQRKEACNPQMLLKYGCQKTCWLKLLGSNRAISGSYNFQISDIQLSPELKQLYCHVDPLYFALSHTLISNQHRDIAASESKISFVRSNFL